MIELSAVALLFAICGAWSSTLYADRTYSIAGAPFAALCGLLLVRSCAAALVVPIIAFVWLIAHGVAHFVAMTTDTGDYLPMAFAGSIGGLGVALAIGVAHPRMLRACPLAGAAVVGFLAALPFGPWLTSYRLHINSTVSDSLQPIRLRYAFTIWQASVGTYIYAISKKVA